MLSIPRVDISLFVLSLCWVSFESSAEQSPSSVHAPLDTFDLAYFNDLPAVGEVREHASQAIDPVRSDTGHQNNPFTNYPRLSDVYYPAPDPSYLDRSVEYFLDSQKQVSSAVRQMGIGMDQYFAGDSYRAIENESYLRLRVANRWGEGGEFEPEFDYKFRLDLPATKQRYRLVLSYRDDTDRSLEDRTRPSEVAEPQGEQSFFAGLVKTLASESGRWEGKVSGGVKVRLPPDPYIRVSGKRFIDVGSEWNAYVGSGVDWFHSKGYHWDGDLVFERVVFHDLLFRSLSVLDWRQSEDTLEFGQTLSLYQVLSDRDALEYQLGVFGTSLSHSRTNIYYLSANYRRDLYKSWLYMEVIPELAFPREFDFTGRASVTISFEVFFR